MKQFPWSAVAVLVLVVSNDLLFNPEFNRLLLVVSLPDVDSSAQIRFDDNIVAVIDPERPLKLPRKSRKERNASSNVEKSFQKERNRDEIVSSSESIVTAETFTTVTEKEIVPVSLCIDGRMYSINKTESPLKKLTEMEHKELESRAGRSRHQMNFDRIESTRTSKSASPQMKKNRLLSSQPCPKAPSLPSSRPPSQDAALPTFYWLGDSLKFLTDYDVRVSLMIQCTLLVPQTSFNRIDSCRMSKATSPIDESKGEKRMRKRDIRRRRLPTDNAEQVDTNFDHLNSLIRTEDEITAIIVAIIIGVIFFVGLCVSIKRNIQ
ncbi:unnamed protein product [Angiostrongylus costaricensis]|uniref:Uncharacterized protein n=1 Tax=Angiostrongylus costaricensis TaxID=334426 RepID=A0A0R3PHB5_ANGCS|nr:unnamed protein product [Angiostrongylus costaricensis]